MWLRKSGNQPTFDTALAEALPIPRRFPIFRDNPSRRQLLECGSPPPLFYPQKNQAHVKYFETRPPSPALDPVTRPSVQSPNVAIISEPQKVARVTLKILLPVAMASILSLESTAAILPQSPGNSGTVDVHFPVPKYYQQYAMQDGNPAPTTGRLFLL